MGKSLVIVESKAKAKTINKILGRGFTVKASVGLGLALSRRLAELMDGTLTYVEAEGSRFRLLLPLPSEDAE